METDEIVKTESVDPGEQVVGDVKQEDSQSPGSANVKLEKAQLDIKSGGPQI